MKKYSLYLSLILLTACAEDTLFHSYKPLPVEEGWERSDTVCFNLPQAEENINGKLTVGLRTVAHIGIQEVVLAVEQCNETTGFCHRDTVHYPLEDAEGKALSGGVNIHQYETQHLPISIRKGQGNTIRIFHLMTHETVYGITELGIRLDKTR